MMPDAELTVRPSNRQPTERANRLREAVRAAGGNQAISQRSGVPLRNLTRYLAGEEMKTTALIALAEASNVSLDWLATGRGPMQPDTTGAPHAAPSERQAGLFGTVDLDRFSAALDGAQEVFRRLNRRPDTRRLTQVTLLLYDAVGDTPPSEAAILAAMGDRD